MKIIRNTECMMDVDVSRNAALHVRNVSVAITFRELTAT